MEFTYIAYKIYKMHILRAMELQLW